MRAGKSGLTLGRRRQRRCLGRDLHCIHRPRRPLPQRDGRSAWFGRAEDRRIDFRCDRLGCCAADRRRVPPVARAQPRDGEFGNHKDRQGTDRGRSNLLQRPQPSRDCSDQLLNRPGDDRSGEIGSPRTGIVPHSVRCIERPAIEGPLTTWNVPRARNTIKR